MGSKLVKKDTRISRHTIILGAGGVNRRRIKTREIRCNIEVFCSLHRSVRMVVDGLWTLLEHCTRRENK